MTHRRKLVIHGLVVTMAALVAAAVLVVVPAPAHGAVTDTFTGSIDAGGVKWRQHDFVVSAPGYRTITLGWDDPSVDLNLGLKNPSGDWVKWASSASGRPEVIALELSSAGTWVVGISARSGGATQYTVTIDDTAPAACPADFCGSVVAGGAAWKQHTVQLSAGSAITATLDWSSSSADLNLGLRDPSGTWVEWAASPTARPEVITYTPGTSGSWTLGVSAKSGAADYTLDVAESSEPPPPPPAGATYVSSFGFGPGDAGHAGLYAYGVDWEPSSETVLVGDIWNHRVLRFTRDGARVPGFELARAGGNTLEPFDVEAGPDGSVWVANEAFTRIDHFTHDGTWIKSIGVNGSPGINYARGCGSGKQHWPTNIAVHPTNGRLYVSDGFCRDVSVFNASSGQFLFSFGLQPATFGVSKLTPRGVDVAPDGDIVLVEHQSRRLAKFSPDGAVRWVSASQPAMLDPRGLAVDRSTGALHVVAAFWNDLWTFTPTGGFVSRRSGVGGVEFDSIRYVGASDGGDVFVGDTWGYRVHRLGADGSARPWSSPPAPPPDGGFNQIAGIAVDPATKRLFAADTFENRMQGFDTRTSTGALSGCMSATNCPSWAVSFGSREPNIPDSPGVNYPRPLAVGGGSVWIDAGNAVVRYGLDGAFISRWGGWGTAPGKFSGGIMGIDVVPLTATTGRVFAVDLGSCRLSVLDYAGNPLETMGSCGTGPDQMSQPWQIDVVGNRAYVVDRTRNAVHVWDVDTGHVVQTISGSFGGTALNGPRGAAVDPQGRWLYIADSGNVRVVRVSLDGLNVRQVVTTGSDTPEHFLRLPRYLAFDPDGRLYVSDFNQRVYVFSVAA